MQFRLLTYNIHKGIGGIDRRYRLERVIEVIAAHDADVLFLQEVDDGVPRSRRDRQVDVIGDALGLPHRAFQANVTLTKGVYGNAIVSRFPLHDVHDLDLTIPLKKRRRALVADCVIRAEHQHTVLLVNAHLGLAGFERRMQVRRVLAHLDALHLRRATPRVFGGDFNEAWRTLGRRLLEPAGFRPSGSRTATFPAAMPVRQLDHVAHAGSVAVSHTFVGHSTLARYASDHLPLVVDLALGREHAT